MLPTTVMEAVTGEAINLPDAKCLVHLQLRRFVDCPIYNTRIGEFRRRWPSSIPTISRHHRGPTQNPNAIEFVTAHSERECEPVKE